MINGQVFLLPQRIPHREYTARRHITGRHSFLSLLCRSFLIRAIQVLISANEVMPSGSTALYFMLGAQLFLLPQCVPHREHSDSDNHDNQDVLHSQSCDSHAAGEKCGCDTPT
jgi:hypothetical protein